MGVLSDVRWFCPFVRQFLRDLASTGRSRASNALVRCNDGSNVARVKDSIEFPAKVGRSCAPRMTVDGLVATGIGQIIDHRFNMRAFIRLTRTSDFGTTIVHQGFLLRGVHLGNRARTIDLSNRINDEIVVCYSFFRVVIARVTPRGNYRARFIHVFGHLNGLCRLATALFQARVSDDSSDCYPRIPYLLRNTGRRLIRTIQVEGRFVVVRLRGRECLVNVLAHCKARSSRDKDRNITTTFGDRFRSVLQIRVSQIQDGEDPNNVLSVLVSEGGKRVSNVYRSTVPRRELGTVRCLCVAV